MSPPLHPNQLRAGDMVRDFRIVRRLGVGGFSFVYLTERAGSSYSLKMAARPVSAEDEDQVDAWMRREVASLEHLEHPNLLPVLEWGRWPDPETGYAWFVTPYVSASTFHEWRWSERASLHRSVRVLCEALKPLESMHERGMCHRDLKADNLLVRKGDDKPFLIDLGSVHLPCARTLTDGLAPGTLHCQPPEVVSFLVSEAMHKGSRLKAQSSADLYAFGVLLYETLTNCRPFSTRLSLEQLLVAIATVSPLEPGQLAPDAPASLSALTLRLLAKEPEQRPPSARAVREELELLLREEGHTAPWQAPAERPSECSRLRESFPDVDVMEEVQEAPSAPEETPAGRTQRAGTRWSRWLIALALGLGLLGLGWTLLRVTMAPPREDGSRAESTAPATLVPPEKGTQSVPSSTPPDTTLRDSTESVQAPSRLCALLTSLLGAAVAQLAGCATTPVRPDPIGYLASCSPEARATPVTLGIKPDEQGSFLKTGTPASDRSIEDGGSLNLKPGPVTADMLVVMKGQELYLKITGEAVTTPNRVYIQFDRLYLPDGTLMPICGVAVDDLSQYGIPTYAKLPIEGGKVDPAMVDKSPGSVVLNDPAFETVLQGPKGYYVPRVNMAPPDWR
ncbi:protein kinase [Archangium violaceum]|uniref:serine/threonine protein kinase n=1 Tax=Archangium violaceum TaxID=83451 RepID=UPI00194E1603|nr:serine/threonine-protein kinase [Archangium violaceum]QRN94871.1 protein kinase [Archangium violaceum]